MAPLSVTEIARNFARKTNFKIEHSDEPNPGEGGISVLRNYHKPGRAHGRPFTRGEPRLRVHIVRQIGTGPFSGLRADFSVLAKGKLGTNREANITAHPDGTVSFRANNLTHRELEFALKHVKTMQLAMKRVK